MAIGKHTRARVNMIVYVYGRTTRNALKIIDKTREKSHSRTTRKNDTSTRRAVRSIARRLNIVNVEKKTRQQKTEQ